jgi:serralysin
LVAGTEYQFDLFETDGFLDPTLGLRNSGGTLLAFNDDFSASDPNPQIIFTPTTTGTYFLDVGGFSTTVGTYELFTA